MKTTSQQGTVPLKNEHEQIGHTELRKTDVDVIKGAQQTDHLERLKANALGHKNGVYRHKKLITAAVVSALLLGGLAVLNKRWHMLN